MVVYGRFRPDMMCPVCGDVGNMYHIANSPGAFACDTCGAQIAIQKGNYPVKSSWAKSIHRVRRTKPRRP